MREYANVSPLAITGLLWSRICPALIDQDFSV